MHLILATTNPAKVRALARHLPARIEVQSLPREIAHLAESLDLETRESCSEIASAKAKWWSNQLPGEFVIATDGGLVIPALGGNWNPARTARFVPTAEDNRARASALLELASHLTGIEREIAWVESLAVVRDGAVLNQWTVSGPAGILADTLPEQRMTGGFWVPYLWLCPEFDNRRLSDLAVWELDQRDDHWRQLADHLTTWIETQLEIAT